MKQLLIFSAIFFSLTAGAQVRKVNLQASGLTCSMCSNAIHKALRSLDFVEKVDANIKNSSFDISFKSDSNIDLDKLRAKVEDAGFAVASFLVTVNFNSIRMLDDNCMFFGSTAFRFINADGKLLSGEKTIRVLDKGFLPAKEFKKNGNLTNGDCYKRIGEKDARIYHVTI